MSFPFELVSDSEYDTLNVPKEKIIIYTKYQQLSQLIEYADLLRSIEDVIVDAALTEEDTSYTILEYILNNTTLKTLEIRFNHKRNDDDRALIKQLQLVSNYLSTSKSIKRFILSNQSPLYLNHQAAEILANGINGSNLEFLGLVNINQSEDNDMALFENISTNTTIQGLILRNVRGGRSLHLDKILGSNLRQLCISQVDICYDTSLSIVNILRNSTKLELFEMKHLFTAEHYFDICDAIAANRSLKTLTIDSHQMQIMEDIQRVLSAVKCHPTIDSFQIGGIWREGLKPIADDLLENNDNNKLRTLTINKLKYGGKGDELRVDLEHMKYFAEKLATNTTLKHLFLGKFNLFDRGINDPTFLNALKLNTTLVTLDIHPKSIIDAKGIIELLYHNKTLTTLAVKEIHVPDPTSFYAAIMQNESLTSLDISFMTYQGSEKKVLQFIADIIVNNTTLKELKCSEIPAKRKKMIALTIENTLPSLKYNHTLTSLDLFAKYKEITESELKIIADVFSTNMTLLKFNSEAMKNRDIELYLRRNREYRVDAVILWYNVVRAEEQVLPLEIWQLILRQVKMFSLAMEVNLNKK